MSTTPPPEKRSWLRPLIAIIRPMITGLLAVLPIILTFMLIGWVADYVRYYLGPDSTIGALLASVGAVLNENFAYVIGAAIALAGLYVIGLVVQSRLRNIWNTFFNETVGRIPLVGTIYKTITRFVQLLERRDDVDVKSMSPVWCFFSDERRTAVLGLMPSDEPVEIEGHVYRIVMVPTAPVPFGGGLFFLPQEWVRPAAFGVEGLTNIYVSMGVTAPDYMGAIRKAKKGPAQVIQPEGKPPVLVPPIADHDVP
ncbi:DUF502 domain-containing protein [Acuticoccus kandeliae]|uniref:DUF502 domain-containing protein n=1 Tax=Acuticoccus kandeliae TaxID=2073160 RepID=UPI000D3E47C5|nr:DUF502 domain-containing protein [Acuticoccus kandeliae]